MHAKCDKQLMVFSLLCNTWQWWACCGVHSYHAVHEGGRPV